MRKSDFTGLIILSIVMSIFLIFMLWISNTGFCLNNKKDIAQFEERFKFCATRINY